MSDMKETWAATYETVNWVYQNRPAASRPEFPDPGDGAGVRDESKLPF